MWDTTGRPRCNFSSRLNLHLFDERRTIGKVIGGRGGGEETKKNQARENVPPKNSFKVKPKGKKSWKGRARYFTKTRMTPRLRSMAVLVGHANAPVSVNPVAGGGGSAGKGWGFDKF